ncbi:putative aminopeptidase W07G4.4 [Galendromus occidentalis]|uniref:Aminopeptidase W07G4.4 n=1 Tax=Galendromus occidentalis TaxID=34638 RepID=A0AAJ6W015_9ACAR|nr:putative aminopeptidase W07G4.4 [Galendromus occidentalis]
MNSNIYLERDITTEYDSVVLVATGSDPKTWGAAEKLGPAFEPFKRLDKSFGKDVTLTVQDDVIVVYSPTGDMKRDYDDVRSFMEAAEKGVKRALNSGSRKPLVALPTEFVPFDGFNVDSSVVLGALKSLYVSLQSREFAPQNASKVERIGFLNFNGDDDRMTYILSLEAGQVVFRDIILADPERMTPKKVEEYINMLFSPAHASPVSVKVISGKSVLEKSYPCLAAVDRCAEQVERHAGRVILLEYSDGNPEKVLGFVGKGITFDAGGVNLKTGSSIAGMSRDKGGAAAVAGIFQSLAINRPKNIRVLGALCLVRNSIGADAYMIDEVIVSRAGQRIRVTNTDAEGRFAMVDALAEMKERVLQEKLENKTHLYTIATLTGAASAAVGPPYSVAVDNGVARRRNNSMDLQRAGEQLGDMIEIGRLRREDFKAVNSKTPDDDLLQTSASRHRGFQYPVAFLMRGSGLDKYDSDSSRPIAYTHLDIAPAAANFPDAPNYAAMNAINYRYFYEPNKYSYI